ncbi:hypothetical protein AW863_RS14515 [Acinetobacter baumannii]|uniref:hypothetical protein n=1 Tax=Acinetobacter calcoaceticus/baumannii complex TaxID=909768 RepID=UPI000707915F|nr:MULTISPECIES: hypothetical protein [Acinetobacter calcoaceticus/baumannii complex]AVI31845.1 hypothetical protein CSB70_2855 [Acinetobacter baumannii]AVI38013.1 hypothetical protein CSB68_0392 [Acinetobacter baumannii]EHU1571438.1 hypothetical protein [Acinetobacter baumannii]EHU1627998.1 hypothetical protein [Acinetobacter baumannii]EHU1652573.1 hypothetical protein [Acinetobacter baumannii]
MNSQFKYKPEYKQTQEIQSFFDPALVILNELHDRNRKNLRAKGYDENNAAVTKVEFSEAMARQFRITQWLAQQIVTSLTKACLVDSFGGYVKPKDGEK